MEEIPSSHYTPEGTVVYSDPSDPTSGSQLPEIICLKDVSPTALYFLVLVGTDDGHYDLTVAYIHEDGTISGSTIGYDIQEDETHTYEISLAADGQISITPAEAIEAQLWIFPPVVHRQRGVPEIAAILRLPEGITKDQINIDQPLVLYPGGIEATRQNAIQWHRRRAMRTTIYAFFDKDSLMNAVPDNGSVELRVVGKLNDGRSFCGTNTVRIGTWRRWTPWWKDGTFEWDFDGSD